MSDAVLTALIAAGVPACVTIVSAILQHRSKRITEAMKANCAHMDERFDELDSRISDLKKDGTRIQLLYLLAHDENDKESILTVARYYFEELKGDWYVSSIFAKWAKKHNVDISQIKMVHK
ncbi:hypothetical protein IJG14_01670 [bacterium]|nr:hypothetical protein [bacterium]